MKIKPNGLKKKRIQSLALAAMAAMVLLGGCAGTQPVVLTEDIKSPTKTGKREVWVKPTNAKAREVSRKTTQDDFDIKQHIKNHKRQIETIRQLAKENKRQAQKEVIQSLSRVIASSSNNRHFYRNRMKALNSKDYDKINTLTNKVDQLEQAEGIKLTEALQDKHLPELLNNRIQNDPALKGMSAINAAKTGMEELTEGKWDKIYNIVRRYGYNRKEINRLSKLKAKATAALERIIQRTEASCKPLNQAMDQPHRVTFKCPNGYKWIIPEPLPHH